MASELSDYQIAALQEMHIPVWQSQDKRSNTPATLPEHSAVASPVKTSVPVSQESARSHLQRLKESVSTKPAPEKTLVSDSKPAGKPVDTSVPQPVLEPLDTRRFSAFIADLTTAVSTLGINQLPAINVGAQLTVTTQQIILPATPDKLSPTHKARLWNALCAIN